MRREGLFSNLPLDFRRYCHQYLRDMMSGSSGHPPAGSAHRPFPSALQPRRAARPVTPSRATPHEHLDQRRATQGHQPHLSDQEDPRRRSILALPQHHQRPARACSLAAMLLPPARQLLRYLSTLASYDATPARSPAPCLDLFASRRAASASPPTAASDTPACSPAPCRRARCCVYLLASSYAPSACLLPAALLLPAR